MKSMLVIGMGRFGTHLAEKLQQLGNDVMVVDKHEEIIEKLAPVFADSFVGDCVNEAVLRSLGVRNFDACFVTIGENFQSSLEITSMLKELGAAHVVSKANSPMQERLLRKIGADEVVLPEREIAEKLAVRYDTDNILNVIELTSDYSIYEIPVIEKWIGRSIGALNIRSEHNVNIIAIKRGDDFLRPLLNADYVFDAQDIMVVIGKSKDIFKLVPKKK